MESPCEDLPKLCDDILSLPPLEADGSISAPASLDPIFTLSSELQNTNFSFSTPPSAPETPLSVSSTGGTPTHERRGHHRRSKNAVKILKSWFQQHLDYPYPTDREKQELAEQTGLNRTQVTDWFGNARRRKRVRGSSSSQSQGIPINQPLVSPLERWKNSPPETEPAATDDILRALADTEIPSFSDNDLAFSGQQYAWSSNESSGSFGLGALSMSSFEQSQSSNSEASVAYSHKPPQRPPTPIRRTRSRHRYRRTQSFPNRGHQATKRAYQCTFCSDAFTTKYDWQRHEKTLHLCIDQWHCAPHGSILNKEGTSICAFCQIPNADSDHLERVHNYSTCREKPPDQRTFSRKDHLRQHLKWTHHVHDYHPSMDTWLKSQPRVLCRCGFCDEKFEFWAERVEHVAEHFKNGADMTQWMGDWGFEPEVQSLVVNAIPAYLVGYERNTVDPWKTSDFLWGFEGMDNALDLEFGPDTPNALGIFLSVHQGLLAYIRAQRAEGIEPSDQMIRDRARRMAYESDDPWNQTYADDPFWLAQVKQEAGLFQTLTEEPENLETNHLFMAA